MREVFLSLGSNQGDRFSILQQALQYIDQRIGQIVKISSYYETEPWGFTHETTFINQVVKVNTELEASRLLERALLIEKVLGRQRIATDQRYSGRTIDIDVLFVDNQIINCENLIVPHQFLHQRRFVLEPLNEIAPSHLHPILNKSIFQLLVECNDALKVRKLTGKDILSSVA